MSACSAATSDHDSGAVDHHLDEPHRPLVGAQPPSRFSGGRVHASHPRLVTVPGQSSQLPNPTAGGAEAAREPGALGEVVVIGTAVCCLQIGPRGGR